MSDLVENQHVRANKATTYFGTSGALSWGLSALAIVIHAPLSVPGLLLIGGGILVAATDKGRDFAKKLGDQLVDLGSDFMSHLGEDVGRLGKLWHRLTAPRPKAEAPKVAAPAALDNGPAFTAPSNAPGFNQAAKPAEATVTAAPAPAPVPPAPKAPGV